MTFLVIAWDGTDSDAPNRRQRVRDHHLQAIEPAVKAGIVKLGGAILDQAGTMIGSAMILEAPDETEARAVIERDIYFTEGVWQRYDIHPFNQAV